VIFLLLVGFLASVVHVSPLPRDNNPGKSSKDTFLRASNPTAVPCGIKEECSGLSAVIKLPAFLKAILPPPSLAVKLNGESQYINTRQRMVPVVWNPTIPIALRKLTI